MKAMPSVEENFWFKLSIWMRLPESPLERFSLVTHSVGTTYTDPGATWTDDLDGSGIILSNSDFNDSQVGTYILDYQFSDSSGNPAVAVSRTVYVLDLTLQWSISSGRTPLLTRRELHIRMPVQYGRII